MRHRRRRGPGRPDHNRLQRPCAHHRPARRGSAQQQLRRPGRAVRRVQPRWRCPPESRRRRRGGLHRPRLRRSPRHLPELRGRARQCQLRQHRRPEQSAHGLRPHWYRCGHPERQPADHPEPWGRLFHRSLRRLRGLHSLGADRDNGGLLHHRRPDLPPDDRPRQRRRRHRRSVRQAYRHHQCRQRPRLTAPGDYRRQRERRARPDRVRYPRRRHAHHRCDHGRLDGVSPGDHRPALHRRLEPGRPRLQRRAACGAGWRRHRHHLRPEYSDHRQRGARPGAQPLPRPERQRVWDRYLQRRPGNPEYLDLRQLHRRGPRRKHQPRQRPGRHLDRRQRQRQSDRQQR